MKVSLLNFKSPLGVGITVLGLASVGLILIVRLVWQSIGNELSVTLLVAVISLVATLWSTSRAKIKDRELQIQAQQSEKREKVVTEFMERFWNLVHDKGMQDNQREEYLLDTLKSFMVEGSLWLSDTTLKIFVDYRLAAQQDASPEQMAHHLAKLMLAFRSDLGHRNDGLTEKDILDVFLNDTDKIIGKSLGSSNKG